MSGKVIDEPLSLVYKLLRPLQASGTLCPESHARFNRRTSSHRRKLFYLLLQNAIKIDHIPLKKLVKNDRGKKPIKHNI